MPNRISAWSRCVLVATGLALAMAAVTPLAAEPSLQTPNTAFDAMSDVERHALIDSVYQRFAELTRASGGEIELTPSKFRSYGLQQFDELYWLDLFTLPRERVLETLDMEYNNFRENGNDVVSFESKWVELDAAESEAVNYEFTKKHSLLKTAEAVQQLQEWDPEALSNIVGVTTYQVNVTFEGIEHSYQAAFLWRQRTLGEPREKALEGATKLAFHVIDHTIPSVTHTWEEKRPVVPSVELRTPYAAVAEVSVDPAAKTTQCYIRQRDEYGLNFSSPTFSQYHSTGGHSSSFRPAAVCSVQDNCHASCAPYAAYQACSESGSLTVPGFKHQKFIKYQASADNGINRVTKCGAAFGCAVKHCLIGTCAGMTWSVSGAKDTIKVSAASTVLADMSLSGGVECDAPDEIPEPGGGDPDDNPDVQDVDPSSGSGGGTPGGGCSWICWQTSSYSEYCELTCW